MLERDTSKAEDFLKRRAEEWRSLCTIDIEALRFDGERAMLEPLLRDPDYVNALARVQETRDELSSAIRASGPSRSRVRLRRPMVPGLFDLLDRCVKVLGLKAPVDLYVTNDGAFNAFVTVTRDRRIVIEVTSGAINNLPPPRCSTCSGTRSDTRSSGTSRRRPSRATTSSASPRSKLALQRYEEVSADRVGLLCCDDVEAALRAEFILTTGITNRDALGDVRAFVEHARRAIDAIDSRDAEALSGFDTHPYGEMRALAIDLFSRSKTFAALVGRDGAALSEAKMEREVARLMRLMNRARDLGGPQGRRRRGVRRARRARGGRGHAGASASSVCSRSSRRATRSSSRRRSRSRFEEQQLRLVELAEVLTTTLPVTDRAAIVADLTVVARVDGRVPAREKAALDGIAELPASPSAASTTRSTPPTTASTTARALARGRSFVIPSRRRAPLDAADERPRPSRRRRSRAAPPPFAATRRARVELASICTPEGYCARPSPVCLSGYAYTNSAASPETAPRPRHDRPTPCRAAARRHDLRRRPR